MVGSILELKQQTYPDSLFSCRNRPREELLKKTLPRFSHVVAPRGPPSQSSAVILKETEVAARSLGLKLQIQEVKEPGDLNRAFEAITKARTGALIVVPGPFATAQRKGIVEFAAKSRLPASSS